MTETPIRVGVMVGLGVVAVMLPGMVLAVRRTPASIALVVMLWSILVSAIWSTRDRIVDHVPLGVPDWGRLITVVSFIAFVLLYERSNDDRGK